MDIKFLTRLCSAAMALSLAAVSSCQREELSPVENVNELRPVYFSDQLATKTHWDGEKICWSKDDNISVTYTIDQQWRHHLFSSKSLQEDCSTAVFEVMMDLPLEYEGGTKFYAVYPTSCVKNAFESVPEVTVEIPSLQQSSSTSFDGAADLMVAESVTSYNGFPTGQVDMDWKRVVAHADVTLEGLSLGTDEVISSMTLTADQSVALTGNFVLDVQTGAFEPSSASNSVTLIMPSDYSGSGGLFQMWASFMPSTVTSMEVKVQTNKAIYVRNIAECNVTFAANVRNVLILDMSTAVKTSLGDASTLMRTSHPRLFLTEDDIPTIRENALGRESKLYGQFKTRVDNLMAGEITFPDPLAATGESNDNHEIGFRAAEAAILWLVSEDETYLEATKTILNAAIDYYQLRVDNNLNIHWYIYSQICALCAYDWIYPDLTAEERQTMGENLFNVMYDIAWHKSGIREKRYRENVSAYTSGCYGTNALPWYIALTFWGDGFDDEKCASMFTSGYNFHNQMIGHRQMMAGENGGGASPCIIYSVGSYPLSDFNFIRTYRSATGVDIAPSMDYVLKYLDFIDWNSLPDELEGSAFEFGFGDSNHGTCRLPYTQINYHLYEIADIFGPIRPEATTLASGLLSQFSKTSSAEKFAFVRLLQKVHPEAGSGFLRNTGKAKYFDTMGQVYMRSGTEDDDTYALFVSGGVSETHKHYDNNNFVIFKHGFRALDSGTRPEPGQHLSHYYARTVAHNCVTIRMPGETFPDYWGSLAEGETEQPVPNDGGQNELLASELKVLEETADYVYLASDATGAYNSAKASLVMREFVWCMPDIFVVFDRVNSTDATYPKTWLYHTAAEPVINGNEFSETSQGGKSICRTLFPEDAVLEKIGGPGYQFWSDGQNWPLPSKMPGGVPNEEWPLLGQWRMEVKPGAERTDDVFMHIIQVGDESLASLPETTTFNTDAQIGVEFEYDGKTYRVAFDKNSSANYGCEITVM